MTPSALRRLAALLDGPDPWPEVLHAVEAEPITSAQREGLLRVFDTLETTMPQFAAFLGEIAFLLRYERADAHRNIAAQLGRAHADEWLTRKMAR